MKIFFVCSGNQGISPIVGSQAESLKNKGIELKIFPIIGKGVWGYLKNIPELKKQIAIFKPDIVHSHYSFCGIITSLASKKIPIVVSLMGSDTHQSTLVGIIIRYFSDYKWTKTIVKSEDMKIRLGLKNAVVLLSNGVDLNLFHPLDTKECRPKLGWDLDKKYVLFASNPDRKEKNFALAQATIDRIKINSVKLKIIYNIDHSQIPVYLNAADVLLLTSKWEGSPNIVKEAMAFGLPVIVTPVGGLKDIIKDGINGYFIPINDSFMLAKSIVKLISDKHLMSKMALYNFNEARKYYASNVVKRIENIYMELLE